MPDANRTVSLISAVLSLALLSACDDGPTPTGGADMSLTDGPIQGDVSLASDAGDDAGDDDATADGSPDASTADAASAPDQGIPDAGLPADRCSGSYGGPEATGPLTDPRLLEASGLVASPTYPGLLWSHNDSGDAALLYALAPNGTRKGRVSMRGVDAKDIEDIAAGPCPDDSGRNCLWVADVGDNLRARDDAVVYAVPEPEYDGTEVAGEVTPMAFPIAFPDGPQDIEALLVEPDGSTFWLLQKTEDTRPKIYRHPGRWDTAERQVMVVSGRFDAPGFALPMGQMITAAELHPSGERLLVRVYSGSYEYRLAPGQTVADLDQITPRLVAAGPLSEPQGEAICYSADGRDVLTVSEARGGAPQDVHRYPCTD